MDRIIVASVQQRLRLPHSLDEYQASLQRFVHAAANKRARLVVFPELAGIMIVPPLLADFRSTLLKHADRGRRGNASLWQRMTGSLANSAAGIFKANFAASMTALLDADPDEVWKRYSGLFSELARTAGVTIVAPSAYLPDPLDGVIRNLCAVFGPGGELLGAQAKVMAGKADEPFGRPGSTWNVIQSEVGALGIMLGADALYPEVGRLLAFQGAEILVALGACPTAVLYNKLRAAALARMQDNQLFAVASYVVGPNLLTGSADTPYVGKSAIFAPQELTPRLNGVLVEMGNQQSEGVVTAEWDFRQLRELWEKGDAAVRRQLPPAQARQLIASLYAIQQNATQLPDGDASAVEVKAATDSSSPPESLLAVADLDELSVIATVTSRWPPFAPTAGDPLVEEQLEEWQSERLPADATSGGAADAPPYEEETDEMDALAGSSSSPEQPADRQ